MLTLIEPPGAKRGVASNNRSAQHLLTFATATDEDDDLDIDEANNIDTINNNCNTSNGKRTLAQRIDKFLVGKSNSYDFSERWKREFSERPSWCDADMTLQQIKRGKARGNCLALYSRSLIQKALFSLGSFVERHSLLVIMAMLTFFSFCCTGLQYVRIETDIVKLWVARGGRLDEELNFLTRVQQQSSTSATTQAKRENGLGGGYQVVIHTPTRDGDNILTKQGLLEHVDIMQQIAEYKIEVVGENWTLADICFKPPSPELNSSSMAATYIPVIDRIIPCIWITPIDCFWEGSKAVGPHPKIEASSLGIAKEFLTSLPSKERFSWSDLNPQAIVDELDEVFSMGNTRSFFHRADIGKGYLDRWCIDPLDAQCPSDAPNHFPFCELLPRFLDYAERKGFEVPIDEEYLRDEEAKQKSADSEGFNFFGIFGGRKKRNAEISRGVDRAMEPSARHDRKSIARAPSHVMDSNSDGVGSVKNPEPESAFGGQSGKNDDAKIDRMRASLTTNDDSSSSSIYMNSGVNDGADKNGASNRSSDYRVTARNPIAEGETSTNLPMTQSTRGMVAVLKTDKHHFTGSRITKKPEQSTIRTTTTEHPETKRRREHREKEDEGDDAEKELESETEEAAEDESAVIHHKSSDFGKESGRSSTDTSDSSSSSNSNSDLSDLYNEEDDEADNPNVTRCKKYAQSMSTWMKNNPDKWNEFLSESEYPVEANYGKVVHGGCRGFAKGVMSWPQDLIIGGAKLGIQQVDSAEALQSVFLVASPNDVYLRFKDDKRKHLKPHLNATQWNVSVAEEVIRTWQRNFTHNLYNHRWNFEYDSDGNIVDEHRRVHPLASTSIADMLEEFCQFNYTIIFAGYLLMLAYALQAQMRHHGCMFTSDSCVGLAFAGVLTVTFASVSGLGLATWFGIEFNAATTQIVPFLTLGIGVDNMFLLLHNYHGVVESVKNDEVGMLMKETGMSVLMTSINNILSFLAGTILPIPALRGFCAQSSILLTFNLLAILTIYPAIISIDLRRRKSARRDVCCCIVADESLISDDGYTLGIGVKPHIPEKRTVGESVPSYHNLYSRNEREDDFEDDHVKPWTLHAFLRHYYIPFLKHTSTKIFVLFVCGCLLAAGLIGMRRASYGLELSDVLPEHTAPAAFLKARDRYFSFYPMFAVLKGPNIDYARDQHKIDNYRRSIGRSRFVVKIDGGEPSEKYWLSLMRAWLRSLQAELDRAIDARHVNVTNGSSLLIESDNQNAFVDSTKRLSADVKVAIRLVCSFGQKYDCRGRLGKVRLVDESGTINVDGFYNYLTAWYNSDSMMYHVSQASFFPAPPRYYSIVTFTLYYCHCYSWSYEEAAGGVSQLVPPAEPFAYSQIPFYLTGLTDTPVIVEMIKEIRAVCDKFTSEGLPNFPSGIAFTFWEQYLHLSSNLAQAICVIAFAVFFVISIIICNPWAAGIIMVILVLMTIELAGFLGLAGIKLNPVSAVTIITAVGIGVEFTAHVVLAFLTSLGDRESRMASAVDRVFVPVIHGAFSTLLGIIMLAFSEFEFVVKYFFVVMSALIAIGVLNGLALLPVLLSLIGPPCEVGLLTLFINFVFTVSQKTILIVTPVDDSDRLPPPPGRKSGGGSHKRHMQEMQTHRRNDSDDSNTGTLGPENAKPPRDGSSSGSDRRPRLVANSHARSASAHITV
ncbi:unnamed protein product [Anisakis simplex]|uniref:Protein patched homolog 2 (inferred by orthology to a human protein) n=1 Tax=Anisakis simplex TaxID=6269 RepID=A0A158PN47_ANISI|nr:unnamed protein product [Anisakis simplex]